MNGGVALIDRLKSGLNKVDVVSLYHAFIGSHLDYCATVWSSAAPTHLKAVGVVQRKALRAMANYDKRKSSAELYREFGIGDIEDHWKERNAVWLLRIIKDDSSVPLYLKELMPFSKSTYNFRQRNNIEIAGKSKLIETTFAWRLKCLFEQLPSDIWSSKSVGSFKTLLSTAL